LPASLALGLPCGATSANANGFPQIVVMDKSNAKYAGLENINILLMLAGLISFIEILQLKYLKNLIEQNHGFIKKITNSMMGFKAFHSAKATLVQSPGYQLLIFLSAGCI
jgi:putative transposase